MELLNGLRLERRRILLPWLTPMAELRTLGAPKIYDERRRKRGILFAWDDEECFGGIACTVSARIFGGNSLRTLTIHPGGEPRDAYARCVAKLQAMLGEPALSICGENDAPAAAWNQPSLEVRCQVSERFGEYVEVSIRRKG